MHDSPPAPNIGLTHAVFNGVPNHALLSPGLHVTVCRAEFKNDPSPPTAPTLLALHCALII
jgi:hypothetical protein